MVVRSGLLVALALLLTSCTREPLGDPVAEDGAVAPAPENDPAVEPSIRELIEEDERALRECRNPGTLVLSVRDVETREPIPNADYFAYRFALAEERLNKFPTMVTHMPSPESESGVFRWQLAEGWHQLRISAHKYRNKWTPTLRIERGQETRLEMEMRRSNVLRVTVLDENGELFGDCGVSLYGDGYQAGMHIDKGVGLRSVPVDEITIIVGETFLKDYAVQEVTVPLQPGIVNEVTIHLRR